MTRFARAKGSKSSNTKTPDDGTPWEVMKQQMLQAKLEKEDNKKRQEAENQRMENYENFLKEQKVHKRKATWCEFPDSEVKANNDSVESNVSVSKKKKKEIQKHQNNESNTVDNNITKSEKSLKNKDFKKHTNDNAVSSSTLVNKIPGKRNKKKKSRQTVVLESNTQSIEYKQSDNTDSVKNNKKQKRNLKRKIDQPVRRKPINDNSFQLIINGKNVELIRYDGFPIMKKDAERLQELKDNMVKKGIPKSEVQRTMKLERRRAEKALARLKREVCYNCRKGGHNLSDCPELKSKIPGSDMAEGVCFKCGSTEHRQFECKVQKNTEFKFATCFICKEPGHIARQCPDNPKGLYPNGGSCKLCGDVTHLRKDCPTANNVKEGSTIKLQTLEDAEDIEAVDQGNKNKVPTETIKKPKKIKF